MRGESVVAGKHALSNPSVVNLNTRTLAMTAAQARLADTIETFYSASDRTSDGAMASHAFKSAVEDLDNSIQREMVRVASGVVWDQKTRSR